MYEYLGGRRIHTPKPRQPFNDKNEGAITLFVRPVKWSTTTLVTTTATKSSVSSEGRKILAMDLRGFEIRLGSEQLEFKTNSREEKFEGMIMSA